MSELFQQSCSPVGKDSEPLDEPQINNYLQHVPGWFRSDNQHIQRSFNFNDYYQAIAFVNAVAWIVHHEDHHPDIQVSYNKCVVRFSTHSVNGLSVNDFICAAKINQLL